MSRSPLLLLVLLCACQPWVNPLGPAATPSPTPTPEVIEPGLWNPAQSSAILRNPNGGWVASNPNLSWSALQNRVSGGEPYRAASVIEMHLSLRDWLAPGDGSDVDAAATGSGAGRVQAALDRRRYVALGAYANSVDDLPPGWATTDVPWDPADPLQASPDGLIATVDLGDRIAPNYADPDYWQKLNSVVAALGDRFAAEPGIAYVQVSGIGDDGHFGFEDPGPWFDDAGAPFTWITWPVVTNTVATTWDDSFPNSAGFLSWRSIEHAFDAEDYREMLENEDFQLRDSCLGGCAEPEFDRFPGGAGAPYPPDDPYGGWLPGDFAEQKTLLGAGGLGGFAEWRIAERDGTWDSGTYGPMQDHLELALDAGLAHGNLRFALLAESACKSEWILADSPPSSPCGTQTVGDLWPPVVDYGQRLGSRFLVTEVRSERQEIFGTGWVGQVDITNLADLPADRDHILEFGFLDLSNREPLNFVEITPAIGTSQWSPGATTTIDVELPIDLLRAADPAEFALYLRVLDERAFGGGLEIAHDDRDEDGRHVLVTWPGL